jgi:hypothetical protein
LGGGNNLPAPHTRLGLHSLNFILSHSPAYPTPTYIAAPIAPSSRIVVATVTSHSRAMDIIYRARSAFS